MDPNLESKKSSANVFLQNQAYDLILTILLMDY